MRRSIIFLTVLGLIPILVGSSCNNTVVRDENAYKAELELMTQMAFQGATVLKQFITRECVCENGKFMTADCERAADLVLIIEHRLPWHKAMSLYNAGLSQERPSSEPPVIPAIETLCVYPPAPAPVLVTVPDAAPVAAPVTEGDK